ncbi:hypothetical protein BJY52DRAFT_1222229 [Lactarius psammicola]|nr:hypothetical protein BJY52DRAFT_1222229 [Lactarius psammicola]
MKILGDVRKYVYAKYGEGKLRQLSELCMAKITPRYGIPTGTGPSQDDERIAENLSAAPSTRPFAALQQQPSLTTTKTPSSATHNSVGAAHEHEHEHTARTLHVVSEPNAADLKYGVPIGAYPNAAPFHPTTSSGQASAHENHCGDAPGPHALCSRRKRVSGRVLPLCARGDGVEWGGPHLINDEATTESNEGATEWVKDSEYSVDLAECSGLCQYTSDKLAVREDKRRKDVINVVTLRGHVIPALAGLETRCGLA